MITDTDRKTADRLARDAWLTANRKDKSWVDYAQLVAAALAKAREGEYPHGSGDVTVIGPECFGDSQTICWRGVNYYADGRLGQRVWPILRHPIRTVRLIAGDYALASSWEKRTGAKA